MDKLCDTFAVVAIDVVVVVVDVVVVVVAVVVEVDFGFSIQKK